MPIIAGTTTDRITNVSNRTAKLKKKASWFNPGVCENRRAPNAMAMMIPAAVMILPVRYTPRARLTRSEKPSKRYSITRDSCTDEAQRNNEPHSNKSRQQNVIKRANTVSQYKTSRRESRNTRLGFQIKACVPLLGRPTGWASSHENHHKTVNNQCNVLGRHHNPVQDHTAR